jgi:hypothetical protein
MTSQKNLIITNDDEPLITVDNIEVAQFIHLLLRNDKIRHIIDTITTKVVVILGRFTDERKVVSDALREELRDNDYLPILFRAVLHVLRICQAAGRRQLPFKKPRRIIFKILGASVPPRCVIAIG